jgi:uncharacterized oligopeptide transporter (OPT) family protein
LEAHHHARLSTFRSAQREPPEFTFRAILLGSIFGIIFGAVTVYVGLRAGLTVAASIPIAVLSISILRAFGRASILENNIVQTTGNAGQSIASGVIFTLPALVFLGFDLEYSRIFMLALIGGWLGVLFMIPLRRQLIVEEHGNLPTLKAPPAPTCSSPASAAAPSPAASFSASASAASTPSSRTKTSSKPGPARPSSNPTSARSTSSKAQSIKADATPEYLGVGYIIGPRVAGVIFAGGVFSWLVLMPLIYFFGKNSPRPSIPAPSPSPPWAPASSGPPTSAPWAQEQSPRRPHHPLKTLPTIVSALTAGFKNHEARRSRESQTLRTEDDLSMSVVIIGSLAIVALMFFFLEFKPVPGAHVGWAANLAASLLVVVFGFLFVTVSSRIVGLIGSSAKPRLRHDHRHPHGHLRHLPRQGLDRPRLRRPRHHHRRRRLHRRLQLRRHLAGPQDRLHHRLHAMEAAVALMIGVVVSTVAIGSRSTS